jgi:hypothetical protein
MRHLEAGPMPRGGQRAEGAVDVRQSAGMTSEGGPPKTGTQESNFKERESSPHFDSAQRQLSQKKVLSQDATAFTSEMRKPQEASPQKVQVIDMREQMAIRAEAEARNQRRPSMEGTQDSHMPMVAGKQQSFKSFRDNLKKQAVSMQRIPGRQAFSAV